MAQNASHATTMFLILDLASSADAFNITRILAISPISQPSMTSSPQTKLAGEISGRQTITVLTLDNGAASSISSLPSDVQQKVLAVHIVLDYYDKEKLGSMKNRSAILMTLFQSTGRATNRMGFINYTKRVDGVMMFGSAKPGAPSTSEMVKSVVTHPYNISVLQISSAIVSSNISSTNNNKAKAPPPTTAKGVTPLPITALTPSTDSTDTPTDAPGPATDSPVADGPIEVNGPAADSPIANGPIEAADAPAHERSSNDASEVSAADTTTVGAGLRAAVLLAMIILL